MATTPLTGIDLSKYTRVGRYTLPEVTNANRNMTAAQLASQSAMIAAGSLLAQEVSGITYNPDTDTLFVEGDGGTSVVQVTKTGQLIDSMTLGADSNQNAALGEVQGRFVSDPEGIAYLGNGQFAITEERASRIDKFTYKPNTVINKADLYDPVTNPTGLIQKVTVGTVNNNIGLEGITYDPSSNSTSGLGFIGIKEAGPEGVFRTNVDFAKATSTNGSSAAYGANLFDPTVMNLTTLSDVYALSNITALNGKADSSHLIVLSRQSGKIVNVDRSGNIFSSLTITADPGDKLSIPNQSHEGVTVDKDGILYIVSEAGGGDDSAYTTPELWVYAPTITTVSPNQAPTAVAFGNLVTSIVDKTSTAARLKVADIALTDDGLGTNNLTLTGTDAAAFEIVSNALYVKANTTIDFKTKASYSVTVNVDDPTVGATPDLTKVFTLAVTDPNAPVIPTPVGNASPLIISEVAPWASGNSPYAADWFEVTNTGTTAVDITGWKIDDNSKIYTSAVSLRGATSIGPGKSVVFIEGTSDGSTDATLDKAFSQAWFGTDAPPTGVTIAHYGGSGVGLSTAGDEVNLFDASGTLVTGIGFGTSTTGLSFDNKAGLGSSAPQTPIVLALSAVGTNGAFIATDGIETGSPGSIGLSVFNGGAGADTLNGTAGDDRLFGLDGNDTISGGTGNDIIYGGAGVDLLFGGAGNDVFGFNNANEGIDKINDFVVGEDKIAISRAGFGGDRIFDTTSLAGSILDAKRFTLGSSATNDSQRFIYNSSSGALFFDADGNGAGAQVRIAQLVGNPILSNNSFTIV